MTVNDLSIGERVYLSRRRHSLTQRDVAGILGITRRQMQELESNRFKGSMTYLDTFARIAAIHDHERCVIARRRSGKSMSEMEAGTGMSRQWIYEMETGREHCGALLNYWGLVGDGLPV